MLDHVHGAPLLLQHWNLHDTFARSKHTENPFSFFFKKKLEKIFTCRVVLRQVGLMGRDSRFSAGCRTCTVWHVQTGFRLWPRGHPGLFFQSQSTWCAGEPGTDTSLQHHRPAAWWHWDGRKLVEFYTSTNHRHYPLTMHPNQTIRNGFDPKKSGLSLPFSTAKRVI